MTTADLEWKYAGVLFKSQDEKGEVVYLLGKEADVPKWSEANKWSDFGGSLKDVKEDPITAMAREATEETMAMRGCATSLEAEIRLKESQGKCIVHRIQVLKAIICVLEIPYDSSIVTHYNNTFTHLKQCMKEHPKWSGFRHVPTCPEGYLEKVELRWWKETDIIASFTDMRPAFLASLAMIKRAGIRSDGGKAASSSCASSVSVQPAAVGVGVSKLAPLTADKKMFVGNPQTIDDLPIIRGMAPHDFRSCVLVLHKLISLHNAWEHVRAGPPKEKGFMFNDAIWQTNIENTREFQECGHSGGSQTVCWRICHDIATLGWDAWYARETAPSVAQ